MAKQTTITLIDDLDGKSAADETVFFSLDGTAYEIDLTAANATKLRSALTVYVAAARKAGRPAATTRSSRKATSDGPSAETIRAWAKSAGMAVNERGRICAELREAFVKAN